MIGRSTIETSIYTWKREWIIDSSILWVEYYN